MERDSDWHGLQFTVRVLVRLVQCCAFVTALWRVAVILAWLTINCLCPSLTFSVLRIGDSTRWSDSDSGMA